MHARERHACERQAYEMHAHERATPLRCTPVRCTPVRYTPVRDTPMRCTPMKVLRGPSASEHRRTSVLAPARFSASSHMGFCAVAYRFQSSPWCPKDHYLGHCTVCLGTSAHRPCFDLSVCLQPVCLQPVCLQPVCLQPVCLSPDSQSDCLRFFSPPRPPPFVDSLDSELWYRSGCRAAALASSSTLAVGQSLRQLFTTRSALQG